ncbi:TRAP transporter large permease subunit [Roseibium salinum]|nr:TRAP transporter large permease subunit [Roseibium salinum]
MEVASSTNGQLTPPVMGAAAFLISEFTGISYPELIKHAFLPAVISYIALVYIVHLEALKLGLQGMKRPTITATIAQRLSGVLFGFLAMCILAAVVYYGLGWIKVAFSEPHLHGCLRHFPCRLRFPDRPGVAAPRTGNGRPERPA